MEASGVKSQKKDVQLLTQVLGVPLDLSNFVKKEIFCVAIDLYKLKQADIRTL